MCGAQYDKRAEFFKYSFGLWPLFERRPRFTETMPAPTASNKWLAKPVFGTQAGTV
jgi:hypothetical protein